MRIVSYASSDEAAWDSFLDSCINATFLHSRRFLGYHRSRFTDASLQVLDARGRLIGLLPAAVDPADPKAVVSHPGATFGGLLRGRSLQGADVIAALEGICRDYGDRGFESFTYKAIPIVYQMHPSEDDLYALHQLGARRNRCDLSSAIDLERRDGPSRRLRRALNRASRHAVEVESRSARYEDFWSILTDRLSGRHNTVPTHTLDEILHLADLFPEHISLAVALDASEVVAGVVLFESGQTVHTQYSASSEKGTQMGALEAVTEACIQDATLRRKRYFDFGISSEQGGAVLNAGLFEFKAKFGASGVAHEFYRIGLDPP